MNSSAVDITTRDGVADAYLTRPDDQPHPAVLYLMDAFGLRPTIEEMADRIAADGYIVLAPNLFYRAGRSPVLPPADLSSAEERQKFFGALMPLMNALTPDALASDGDAYLSYLESIASPGPVAISGYCLGGRVGWRIAAAHPGRVAALAGFHAGGLVNEDADSPHLSAADIEAELYFGFADEDPSMTAEQIETLGTALAENGKVFRTEVYEGAHHGYTMADSAVFNEAARERHFRELRSLLERTVAA